MKILIACDGSQGALRAVNYGSKLAQLLRSENRVTVVSVHDVHDEMEGTPDKRLPDSALVGDELLRSGDVALTSACDLHKAADVAYALELRTGHVAQEIVRCADEGNFDVIVLGPQGHGAIADPLIGSVAQSIIAASNSSVVVVK